MWGVGVGMVMGGCRLLSWGELMRSDELVGI
jgi:hypothetical protein